jgi:hypothetical protein
MKPYQFGENSLGSCFRDVHLASDDARETRIRLNAEAREQAFAARAASLIK